MLKNYLKKLQNAKILLKNPKFPENWRRKNKINPKVKKKLVKRNHVNKFVTEKCLKNQNIKKNFFFKSRIPKNSTAKNNLEWLTINSSLENLAWETCELIDYFTVVKVTVRNFIMTKNHKKKMNILIKVLTTKKNRL